MYDVEEIAELFNLKRRTIQERLRSGVIPGKKIGGEWWVLGEDLIKKLRVDKE